MPNYKYHYIKCDIQLDNIVAYSQLTPSQIIITSPFVAPQFKSEQTDDYGYKCWLGTSQNYIACTHTRVRTVFVSIIFPQNHLHWLESYMEQKGVAIRVELLRKTALLGTARKLRKGFGKQ